MQSDRRVLATQPKSNSLAAIYDRRLWVSESFWRVVTRLDRSKINNWIAFRNSLAVAIPLAVGTALHNPVGGVAIATGALNVMYSDGTDPYSQRARRMLAWTALNGVAVFLGSVTGGHLWLSMLAVSAWAFVGGLANAVSTRAGDLGLNTLVAMIVFGARGALSARGAAIAALLVMCGGLLQLLFALLFWPLRRYLPERRAIGHAFLALGQEILPSHSEDPSTPWAVLTTDAQDALDALGRDHSIEGERYRLLFDQADRLRLSAFALQRMRSTVTDTQSHEVIDPVLAASGAVISSMGTDLADQPNGHDAGRETGLLQQLQNAVDAAHREDAGASLPFAHEICSAVDVLAGQVRVAASLASRSTPYGAEQFAKQQRSNPWRLQLSSWFGTMRANLNSRSSFFRHAIRLTLAVALAEIIAHSISWQRAYWLPMTVAVVLKPDFTTTISRGVLRLAGTFTGLLLATLLYLLFPPEPLAQLLLVGAFTFLLRSIGTANYGVFSVCISGLIVFLIAATGIPPGEVVLERALNTAAGGCLALIVFAAWPTWERTQVSDAMAEMLDASRDYVHAVISRFGSGAVAPSALDGVRAGWRRARSKAEASVDRICSEPRTTSDQINLFNSMLASSHALVYSIMALESALVRGETQTPDASLTQFTNDIELTLYILSAALRGSQSAAETLPKLRDDHQRMVEVQSRLDREDDLVLIETDRITVSLNTLREQIMRYVALPHSSGDAQ